MPLGMSLKDFDDFCLLFVKGQQDDYLLVKKGFDKIIKSPGMMVWRRMGEQITPSHQIYVYNSRV